MGIVMKTKINLWSFICSLGCIVLFFIAVSSGKIINLIISLIHIHPLNIVLGISVLTFLLGVIGLSGAANWKLLVRGISTVIIAFGLSALILFITFLSSWIPFT